MNDELRAPPHDLHAECATLGGLVLDNRAWSDVTRIVAGADFYRREHRVIFGAIADLARAGSPFDLVTLAETLEAAGTLDDAGGLAYLGTLVNDTPSAANVRAYAAIVARKARHRDRIAEAEAAAQAAWDAPPDDVLAPPRLRPVDLSRMEAPDLSPPEFVVSPLIPRGHLTLFGGHGGSGKTTLSLVIAAHVAAGRRWAGLDVQKGRVLFVSYEDRQELTLWRLRAIADEYTLNRAAIRERLTIIDATEAAPIVAEESAGGVRRIVPSRDGETLRTLIREGQHDLVIVDNASDAFDADENSRRQVRGFVRFLADAVKPHGGAVVLLAHIDKAAARLGGGRNSYSGSTGWHNSARSRLALVDGELRQEKLNVGKPLDGPVVLAWSRSGVPVPETSAGAATARQAADEADDAALLACFDAAAQAGLTVPAAESGPSTTWHALSVYPECPKALRQNKQRFRQGIARLLRANLIRAEEYRTDGRKLRTRLIRIAPQGAPMCANPELAQNWREHPHPCASPMRKGCGDWSGAPEPAGGTGAPQPDDEAIRAHLAALGESDPDLIREALTDPGRRAFWLAEARAAA